MPPEQLCGEPIDRRADIYATGVVLWELLTRRHLFEPKSDELMALLRQALDTSAPPPSTYDDTISIELDTIVMRAVERDAPNRFATAAEMASALEALASAASSKEVAAFVAHLARSDLDERAEMVARVEQTTIDDPEADPGPSPVPVYTPPPRSSSAVFSDPFAAHPRSSASPPDEVPRERSSLALLVAILVGVVLAAILLVTFLAFRTPAAPATAATVAAVTVAAATIDAGPPEPPAPSLVIVPPELPASSARLPAKPRKTATPAITASSSATPSCDPPYLIDSRGIRIPRRECLGN